MADTHDYGTKEPFSQPETPMTSEMQTERKVLHMIGNSHIDPVWYWKREEGMQEVKATFASAVIRMQEYSDFCFTCTSSAFFSFLEDVDPLLMEEIKSYVKAGRFEITGGWWVEPDCNLPCGEAFVRQGLYGQRYLKKTFGFYTTIGSNVDSFGHNTMLPQILRGCGMNTYLFMRPSLTRSDGKYMESPVPLVSWQSPDGSSVQALCLPAEYTCWFPEAIQENIETTIAELAPYPALPCFYGVGNHGGGPTIANIEAIHDLQAKYPLVELRFSTLQAFFEQVKDINPVPFSGYLEDVNTGCYSVDHRYKKAVRFAEQALLQAERLLSMAALAGDGFHSLFSQAETLWRRLLFCQFHDTLGGTCIRPARDNALRDVQGVTAQAEKICQIAVQRLAGRLDTQGDGIPLLLINDSPLPYHGIIDTELNWFCKDPLSLRDENGREISYQRTKQSCTMVWSNLGGRRRVLFPCDLPPFGFRVLRAYIQEPSQDPAPSHTLDRLCLENEQLLAEWNEDGDLCFLMDKATGFQVMQKGAAFHVWKDERDSWGNANKAGIYWQTNEKPSLEEARVTERGRMRQTLRVRKHLQECRLEILYTLDTGDDFLRMSVKVLWDGPWKALKLHFPFLSPVETTVAESPYGVMQRTQHDKELYMHRFVDAADSAGRGLTVVNDGIYGFSLAEHELQLILLRSSIYSQGTCPGWQHDYDTYEYIDLGEHDYEFLLKPHGHVISHWEMAALADRLSSPPICLMDTFHPGEIRVNNPQSFLEVDEPNIRLSALKKWEDGKGLIIRLYETEGKATSAGLTVGDRTFSLHLKGYEIQTLLLSEGKLTTVNMLEADENE